MGKEEEEDQDQQEPEDCQPKMGKEEEEEEKKEETQKKRWSSRTRKSVALGPLQSPPQNKQKLRESGLIVETPSRGFPLIRCNSKNHSCNSESFRNQEEGDCSKVAPRFV